MRISDWSSDVCSSDLSSGPAFRTAAAPSASSIAFSPLVSVAAEIFCSSEPEPDAVTSMFGRSPMCLPCGLSLPCSFPVGFQRSEEHTSELQSLMRTSYAVFCLKTKIETYQTLQALLHNNQTLIYSTSTSTHQVTLSH